ncbi:hypothetical protein COE18_04070 [Bacillus cereus]|nr:hypothetical protein COE18_04070 [Bacillus cereus]
MGKKHQLKLKRDTPNTRKNKFNENFFSVIDIEEKAYILGFIMADGCIGSNRRTLDIKIAVKDIDILHKINKATESIAEIKDRENGRYKTMSLCSKKMVADLEKWSVTRKKSATLKFPELKNVEMYRHFLRGIFDGDGHIGKRQCALIVGSSTFFKSFMSFLDEQFSYKPWYSDHTNYFHLQFSRKDSWFIKWLYTDCSIYLDRKYKSFKDNWEAYRTKGTEVEDKKPLR